MKTCFRLVPGMIMNMDIVVDWLKWEFWLQVTNYIV